MSEMTPDDVRHLIINPFYAINIAPMLAEPHEPMVSRENWIAAQEKILAEDGPTMYFERLLSVLEGKYPGTPA